MTLHLSQIGLTDALTFIKILSFRIKSLQIAILSQHRYEMQAFFYFALQVIHLLLVVLFLSNYMKLYNCFSCNKVPELLPKAENWDNHNNIKKQVWYNKALKSPDRIVYDIITFFRRKWF